MVKKEFGDIFLKFSEFEEKVNETKKNLILNHCNTNKETLHERNSNYIRYPKSKIPKHKH